MEHEVVYISLSKYHRRPILQERDLSRIYGTSLGSLNVWCIYLDIPAAKFVNRQISLHISSTVLMNVNKIVLQ